MWEISLRIGAAVRSALWELFRSADNIRKKKPCRDTDAERGASAGRGMPAPVRARPGLLHTAVPVV